MNRLGLQDRQYFELTETSECSWHWRELAERLLWEKKKLFHLILSLPNQWWSRPKGNGDILELSVYMYFLFTRPSSWLLCCGRHIGRMLGWYSRGSPAIFSKAMSFSSLLLSKSGWTMTLSNPLSMWSSGSFSLYRWWSPSRNLRLLIFEALTNWKQEFFEG